MQRQDPMQCADPMDEADPMSGVNLRLPTHRKGRPIEHEHASRVQDRDVVFRRAEFREQYARGLVFLRISEYRKAESQFASSRSEEAQDRKRS